VFCWLLTSVPCNPFACFKNYCVFLGVEAGRRGRRASTKADSIWRRRNTRGACTCLQHNLYSPTPKPSLSNLVTQSHTHAHTRITHTHTHTQIHTYKHTHKNKKETHKYIILVRWTMSPLNWQVCPLLLPAQAATVLLWWKRGHTVVTLLLHCCYTVVALFWHCCYTFETHLYILEYILVFNFAKWLTLVHRTLHL
jgi:hypothetical protein